VQVYSAEDLARRTVERRAVEAVIWGMPAVNFDLMYQAFVGIKGGPNQIAYWSRPLAWKNQTLTPNPDTIYFMPFYNTKDGPVVLDIPPEQVVGSMGKQKFELRGGKPVSVKLPAVDFIDDKEGKPIGIQKFIGRRPVLAFGNSDGDLQMLQWTAEGPGPRFMGLVHHTDAEREWAYDRTSHIGKLDKALDEARAKDWTIVDMKRDWKRVFAFE